MKSNYSWIVRSLAMAWVIFGVSAVRAATVVYVPVGNPSNAVSTGGMVAGGMFRRDPASAPITYNSLGFIDLHTVNPTLQGPDGISGTYQVSLWRIDTYTQSPPGSGPVMPTSWTLLGSTTITPASPLGENPGDPFRYNWIPAATINPGDYFILGATLPTGPLPDKWLNGNVPVNSIGIIGPATGYTLSSGTFSLLGSQAMIANASTQFNVPEPVSLSLLALGCLMLRRRRGGGKLE